MTGRTTPDNVGHVRGTDRTDNTPLKGVSVRCPVRPPVRRPSRKQIRDAREGLAALLGKPQVTTRLQQDANQFGGARATGPTRTGDHTACSDTASAEKADAWAVPTIAVETGQRVRACGSSDSQSATGRDDVQVSAYLPICAATTGTMGSRDELPKPKRKRQAGKRRRSNAYRVSASCDCAGLKRPMGDGGSGHSTIHPCSHALQASLSCVMRCATVTAFGMPVPRHAGQVRFSASVMVGEL